MSNSALIEDLERQFSENPRRVFARLANEYRKSGNLDGAIALCREHVPKHPGYISGHIVLGQAFFESGALEDARQSFDAALQLDPENIIALRHLGDIARQSGELDEASSWYRRLLEVDPQNEDAVARLSGVEDRAEEPPLVSARAEDAEAQPAAMPQDADEPVGASEPEPIDWSDINPETALRATAAAVSPDVTPDGPADGDYSAVAADAVLLPFEEAIPASPQKREYSDSAAGAPAAELARDDGDFASGEIEPESGPFDDPSDRATSVEFDMPSEEILTFDSSGVEEEVVAELGEPEPSAHATEWQGNVEVDGPVVSAGASGADEINGASEMAAGNMDNDGVRYPNGEGEYPAFVTETVADVYERQGHLSQALEVYRQLAAQHPANEMLRAHVARLEGALTALEPEADGDTIREIFGRVMQRRAPAPHASPAGGALFPGAPVSADDDRAATALAAAFSPEFGGGLSERGRPARAAEDELSLESVFGNPPPAPPQADDDVSFDEFFPDAGRGEGTAPADGSVGDTPGDDETFHSWLDGLKR